jgi:hypothetical protein
VYDALTLVRSLGRWICLGFVWLALAVVIGWSALAIYYSNLSSSAARQALSFVFVVGSVATLTAIRPLRRGAVAVLTGFVVVLVWFFLIPPSNDRAWQPDVAVLPRAIADGDRVTIENIRNNEYRTEFDYTPRYETRTYDLATLRSLDLFLVYWGSPLIAHTIMSFGFDGDRHLAISIETRKDGAEAYSAVRGFFRQYELIYIVADERDVVRLRTNYRGEEVYLFRLAATPAFTRQVLLDYLITVNGLRDRPQWYNALTHNCTTAVRGHMIPYVKATHRSWKILLNGKLDEYLYAIGAVRRDLPLAELRARGQVNARAKAADRDPEFSRRIREGVPAPSAP